MSRATHYIQLPEIKNNLASGKLLPLVAGKFDTDWDVVEEELDAGWVAEMRRSIELKVGRLGNATKPIGVNNEDVQRHGAVIKAKGEKVMGLPTVDQVVAKYVETREQLKKMQAELDEQTKPLKEFQQKREQWLMGELNKIGAKNVKTPHGTVYQTTTESVTMADWDSFFSFVQETKQFNLLTHAVNKTAALEIMGEERQNALPPGVNYVAIRTVNVRKS